MPLRRPIRCVIHVACLTSWVTLQASVALAGVSTPHSSAFVLRHALLATAEGTPQPTSAAAMGAAPKQSKRTWLYVGLAALAVGSAIALAGGGGDSAPAAQAPPIDPPPPPPPAGAQGGAR
ncbi:MAG: hypothetical protein HZA61_09940 [Candidatus Eisenbacteria bacterium]|uniref:Uncharacterized protein n=1 Tax=Eiseniibacteriota bacterium TaxID=2212470 RepID=A0A933W8R9_UNCEI|nr:hypothetical protein [Candidatus Eisenbacteria bacterium]